MRKIQINLKWLNSYDFLSRFNRAENRSKRLSIFSKYVSNIVKNNAWLNAGLPEEFNEKIKILIEGVYSSDKKENNFYEFVQKFSQFQAGSQIYDVLNQALNKNGNYETLGLLTEKERMGFILVDGIISCVTQLRDSSKFAPLWKQLKPGKLREDLSDNEKNLSLQIRQQCDVAAPCALMERDTVKVIFKNVYGLDWLNKIDAIEKQLPFENNSESRDLYDFFVPVIENTVDEILNFIVACPEDVTGFMRHENGLKKIKNYFFQKKQRAYDKWATELERIEHCKSEYDIKINNLAITDGEKLEGLAVLKVQDYIMGRQKIDSNYEKENEKACQIILTLYEVWVRCFGIKSFINLNNYDGLFEGELTEQRLLEHLIRNRPVLECEVSGDPTKRVELTRQWVRKISDTSPGELREVFANLLESYYPLPKK